MTVTARLKYLRIAPRKVRLVADLIREKKVEEAQTILNFTTKKAARSLSKLLGSAIANARSNFQLEPNNLYISKITVDEGPKYKRWMARARGVASEIQKKTSHITLILDEIAPSKKAKKVKKAERPAFARPGRATPGEEKPKLRPEAEVPKPKIERGIKRIFRRKAF